MTPSVLNEIKVIAFDAYGTLFNVASVDDRLEHHYGDKAHQIAAAWRRKQLEYTWLRSLMNRYKNFYDLTQDALSYALETAQVSRGNDNAVKDLMDHYNRLTIFPDVKEALSLLSQKYQLAILSNANLDLLQAAASFNKIDVFFTKILSVDAIKQFKPIPAVYQIPVNEFALPREQIAFVSSNTWDVAGAKSFGLKVVWAKRKATSIEQLGYEPDLIVKNLMDLVKKIADND